VLSGGATVSSLLEGSNPAVPGGKEIVGSGGIATATRLTGPGLLIVGAGGTAQSTVVDSRNNSGGVIVFGRGLALGTVIDSGSTEFLSGGTEDGGIVGSGGRIVVRSGGTAIDVTISGGGSAIISAGGLITADAGGTATIDGVVINSGLLLASTASSLIDIAGVVSGGGVKIGDGMVEVESGGTANVTFLSTGTGGLEIADTASDPTAFTGTVSGFGGVSHANHAQFIDLLFVTSDATVSVNFVSAASHTSGALMVSSGGQLVASIDLIGVYSTGDLRVVSGVSATVKILDPAVGGGGSVDTSSASMVWLRNSIDPPGVAAGARRTLAGTTDGKETRGNPPAAAHATAVALLGNYMAASFVDAAHAHGGTRVIESEAAEHPQLTHLHR
jgi:autotransporter passenger strand-loop-strand repeat protein